MGEYAGKYVKKTDIMKMVEAPDRSIDVELAV
jgi:hypothetical protein